MQILHPDKIEQVSEFSIYSNSARSHLKRNSLTVDSLIPYAMFHGSYLSETEAVASMP